MSDKMSQWITTPLPLITNPDEKFQVPESSKPTEGFKRDNGKARWDLAPWDAMEEMVKVMTWAMGRPDSPYPVRNWELGMTWGRVFRALMSHSTAWWLAKIKGEDGTDAETGISHLAHAMCCVAYLLSYELRKGKHLEFDDRPKKYGISDE